MVWQSEHGAEAEADMPSPTGGAIGGGLLHSCGSSNVSAGIFMPGRQR